MVTSTKCLKTNIPSLKIFLVHPMPRAVVLGSAILQAFLASVNLGHFSSSYSFLLFKNRKEK